MYRLVLIVLLSLPSLGWSAPLRVTFVNPGFEAAGFWHDVTATMQAAAAQLDFELTVVYGDREWPKMVAEAERVITSESKPDYLILVNEHQQGARLLQMANEREIPTLMLLNTLTETQQADIGAPRSDLPYWLGSLIPNNDIAGYQMALSLLSPDRESVKLLSLIGDTATPASIERVQGLDRALSQSPALQEQRRFVVNWSEDTAYQRVSLWLDSGQPVDAIWAANDNIAVGASRALREHDLVPGEDVLVAGLNWSPAGLSAVADNQMTMTHGGHFFAGAWAMVLLYDYHYGRAFGAPDSFVEAFPMSSIAADNVADYVAAFGDQDWTKIDFQSFSLAKNPTRESYDFSLSALLNATD